MSTWISYRADGVERTGVVVDGAVHAAEPGVTLLGLLEAGVDLDERAEAVVSASPGTVPMADVDVAPLLRPPVLADGMLFWDHIRHCYPEWDPRHEKWPYFWIGNPLTVVGANDPVRKFTETEKFDYELEIGAVIGSSGENLAPDEAEDAIVGYTIFVDWSGRDVQMERIVPLKGKDGATTLGPVLVTKSELEPYRHGKGYDLEGRVWINGEPVSTSNWASIDWSFADLVSYVSRGSRLAPGVVIGSGTLGWSCLLELERAAPERFPGWLAPGDVVEIEVERLGRTRQVVTDPLPLHRLSSGW